MVKIAKADYAYPDHPDGPKYPITTQQQVHSAARLLGKIPDAATKATVKARIKRIANRKGFALPAAWLADKPTKKPSGEAVTPSDGEVRMALQAALDDDADPDGDGDDDRADDAEPWERPYCYISAVFRDETPIRFIYSFDGDDDDGDDGLYQRTGTLDENGTAVMNDDIKRVIRVVTYVDYVEQPEEQPGQESTTARESYSEATMEAVAVAKGEITGTAIKPGFNKQGYRYYPKETLASALALFPGTQMYFDHPSRADEKNRPERSIRDLGAVIKEAWLGPEGEIRYRATLIDPELEAKITRMQERGVMGAFGTSVSYQGIFSEAEIEGRKVARSDAWEALNSLDFVTSPGAWGDIARMESDAGDDPAQQEGDDSMDEAMKEMQAKIDLLTTQVTASRQEAADERTARRIFETKTLVKDALATAKLPQAMKDRVLASYEGAEEAADIAATIAAEEQLYESIKAEIKPGKTEVAAPRRVGRVIVGNGGAHREAEGEERPKAPPVAESGGWFLGKNAKSFEESFVTG